MYASGGGGGGGHFVGLDPDGARSLATGLAGRGALATTLATRISGMLCEAGPEGAGCETPQVLRRMDTWLETSAEDVRWRIEVVAGGATTGGMRFASLMFPSAAAAHADGQRYGRLLKEAMDRYWEAYGDDGEDEATQEYLRLVQAMAAYTDDPMWSAGVVNTLGTDGISNSLWVAKGDAPEDFDRMRETVGPLFQALASAMEHGEAAPNLRRELMTWPTWDLALVLALAPAETGFLTAAAKKMLVHTQTDDTRQDDPGSREYELIFSALAENPEASFRVLTGNDRHGFPNTAHILMPWDVFTSPESARELGRMLEVGLVEYPAAHGGREWNQATTATEEVMQLVARMRYVMDEVHPDLNASLASLLRPHLDAIALISARDNGSTAPGDLEASLPRGRRALDVDIDTLEDYLGATMQQDSGVAAVQLLLAAYSQQPSVQAHRLPLLSQDIGSIREFDDFATDSVRIAALAGVIGAGLDKAGHDEEARTRLLVGALNFASGKATGALPVGRHPAVWLGQKGADYLAGQAIDEVEEWLQSREPMEGEVGVGSFLESYTDTTVSSLREHIAADPELSQLSPAEQDELIESVRHWVRESVRGPLMEQYAELVGETAGE